MEEKYTWKIVGGVYIPGTETVEEHIKRMGYKDFIEEKKMIEWPREPIDDVEDEYPEPIEPGEA